MQSALSVDAKHHGMCHVRDLFTLEGLVARSGILHRSDPLWVHYTSPGNLLIDSLNRSGIVSHQWNKKLIFWLRRKTDSSCGSPPGVNDG